MLGQGSGDFIILFKQKSFYGTIEVLQSQTNAKSIVQFKM